MRYWLMKSEPAVVGIDDVLAMPDRTVDWWGVRNYQARNFLRAMAEGDEVFVYHASCKDIGIAGVVRVARTAYVDPTQFDPQSPYFDAKSTPDKPRWDAVDMVFGRKLARLISLDRLKALPGLENLPLVQRGSRLSVMPVGEEEWRIILGEWQ